MNTTHTILPKLLLLLLLLLLLIIIMSHIEFVFTSLSALSESGTFGQKLKISPNAIFGDYPCERILNNKY